MAALSSSLFAAGAAQDLAYRGENERGGTNRNEMNRGNTHPESYSNHQETYNHQDNYNSQKSGNPYNHGNNSGDKAAYHAGYNQGSNNEAAASQPIIIEPDANVPPAGVPNPGLMN